MDNRNLRFSLIKSVALMVILISLVTLACGGGSTEAPVESFSYSVRILKEGTSQKIPNAKVTIEVTGQAPLDEITDSNGLARISINSAYAGKPGRLLVEVSGYENYRQEIDLIKEALPDTIPLKPAPNEPIPISTIAPTPTTIAPSITTIEPLKLPAKFAVDSTSNSSIEGFKITLTTVEFLENKRMRWSFDFKNDSQEDVGLGFDYENTYVVDDLGVKYKVVAADVGAVPDSNFRDLIERGVKAQHWLEFPAPENGASTFQIYIVAPCILCPAFPIFDFATSGANRVENSLAPTTIAASIAPTTIVVNQTFPSSTEGFNITLTTVEFLENNRMRWSFDFKNDSKEDIRLGFDYEKTYVADEFGKKYTVVAANTGSVPDSNFRDIVERGVKAQHWLEFSAPDNGAKIFQIHIVAPCILCVEFPVFEAAVK